jgi:hypothetical protein
VPVSQRIWTPRGYGPPGPYQLVDSDPYGTYPLKEEILKRFAVECAWNLGVSLI